MDKPGDLSRTLKKRGMAFIAAMAFGAAVFSGCSNADGGEAAVKISTQAVKKGDLVIGLYADGRIALDSTPVDFEIAGEIQEIKVSEGQVVQAGDLLAVLDAAELDEAVVDAKGELEKAEAILADSISGQDFTLKSETLKMKSFLAKSEEGFNSLGLKDAVKEAEAEVSGLKSDLKAAEADYEEAEDEDDEAAMAAAEKAVEALENTLRSAEGSLGSLQRSYDAAYAKYKDDQASAKENYELQKLKVENLEGSSSAIINAQYGVDTAKGKVDAALKNQAKASLLAPVAGQIAQISAKPGDSVSAGTEQSGIATDDLMTITDQTRLALIASINEGDIAQLTVGQLVRANIEALGLIGIPGKVTALSRLPKIDNSGIVSYEVSAVLDEPDAAIFDGMSAFITYIKKEKLDVLMISNKAIFIEEGQQYVQVQKDDGTLEKRAIIAGLTNGSVSEILEGLAEGESVVTSGASQ